MWVIKIEENLYLSHFNSGFYSCLLFSVHLAVHCSSSSTHVCCTMLTLASLKGQMNMTSCDIRVQLEQMCQPPALQPGQFLYPRPSHTHTNMRSLFSEKGLVRLMGLQQYWKCRWACVLNWIARFDAETDCKL